MKFLKKCLSVLMASAIIITPLIPSKSFASSIYDMSILDSMLGDVTVGVYYESPIPTSTKNLVVGVDTNLTSDLDISLTGGVGNLIKNYLTNNNYLVNKNLPIQGDDNIMVVIRDLPGSSKGQVAPNAITENGLNILYMDIDMFKSG